MELAIPLSKFSHGNIKWGHPRVGAFRRTIPFGYDEGASTFNSLILVLQPLKIVEYDEARSQLILEDTKRTSAFSKLELLQTHVGDALSSHKDAWLEGCRSPTEFSVQPWVRGKRLTLHLSSQKEMTPFFSDAGPLKVSATTLRPGEFVRPVVKLQGLSLQMSDDENWTGKSRIQHHVLQLFKVDVAAD